jgi:hypothetical protein
MPRIATLGERYQSYNIEMASLTGGMFWKPYDQLSLSLKPLPEAATGPSACADFYAALKASMAPIDLTDAGSASIGYHM